MKPALANPARIILLAGPVLMAGPIWAQATTPAFEVASVRAAEFPNPGPRWKRTAAIPRRDAVGCGAPRLGLRLAGRHDPVRVRRQKLSGVRPDWMRSSRWNVVARLPEGASQDQVPKMMQALLAERFQLKAHHEKRSSLSNAIEVAKGGPRLEAIAPSNDDSTAQAPAGASLPVCSPDPSEPVRPRTGWPPQECP